MDDEEIVPVEEAEDPKSQLKALREKLKACEAEKKEYLDGWQRARADFMNARKNEAEDRERAVRDAQDKMLREFANALDSFEWAMKDATAWEKVDAVWRKGVESIHTQCLAVLRKYGLETYGTPGEMFDPRLHVSVGMETTDEKAVDNTIREVFRSGYKVGERVVRPAEVKVAYFEQQ